jgi:hypothetical protein
MPSSARASAPADRDIARVLGVNLGQDGQLTDEIERRLFEHLTGDRGFRP